MPINHTLAIFAAIAAIALVPVGCGGSSGSDQSAGSEETAAAKTVPDSQTSSGGSGGDAQAARDDKTDKADGSTKLSPAERQRDTALVEQVMRDLIQGMNTQDESVCTRLFDRHLIDAGEREEETAKCESTIANHPGGVELVRIESVRFRRSASGTESLASILTRQADQPPARLAFHLMKSDGAYKIDRGVPAE